MKQLAFRQTTTLHPLILPDIPAKDLGRSGAVNAAWNAALQRPLFFQLFLLTRSLGVPDEQTENLKEHAQKPPSREGSIGHSGRREKSDE